MNLHERREPRGAGSSSPSGAPEGQAVPPTCTQPSLLVLPGRVLGSMASALGPAGGQAAPPLRALEEAGGAPRGGLECALTASEQGPLHVPLGFRLLRLHLLFGTVHPHGPPAPAPHFHPCVALPQGVGGQA